MSAAMSAHGFLLLLALLTVTATAIHAADPLPPVTQFLVYNNTDCSGPLFTLDTTWQSFTALTASQVSFGSLIIANNTPNICLANVTANTVSSMFQCVDYYNYSGTGYGGVTASGWSVSDCPRVNDNRVYRYQAFNSDSFNQTNIDNGGCQVGTVISPGSGGRSVSVGMKIKCAVPASTPNHAAAVVSTTSAFSLLLACVLIVLSTHLLTGQSV